MIQLPESVKVIAKEGNRATFEIGPLMPGYGPTIANPLRRVLLSSLEGAAITSVKIKGVDHEFSTIKGVVEDVTEIILNFLHFKAINKVVHFLIIVSVYLFILFTNANPTKSENQSTTTTSTSNMRT